MDSEVRRGFVYLAYKLANKPLLFILSVVTIKCKQTNEHANLFFSILRIKLSWTSVPTLELHFKKLASSSLIVDVRGPNLESCHGPEPCMDLDIYRCHSVPLRVRMGPSGTAGARPVRPYVR